MPFSLHEQGLTPAGEVTRAGAFSAPPIAVTGGTMLGMPLGDVVLWGTLLYIALQILVIAPKVPAAWKELFGKKPKDDKEKKCAEVDSETGS